MRGRRPVPALRRPASPRASPEARSSAAEGGGLRRRAASSVAGGGGERGAAVSRPPPGPAPEGRWDELSSGECASLGAKGGGGGGAAHRAHCRGGFGNDVMGRGVSRQAPRALGRAAGAPLLPAAVGGWVGGCGGSRRWGAGRCWGGSGPAAARRSAEPGFRGQSAAVACWRAAPRSWRGAGWLRTKQHSWKLAAVQRLSIQAPFSLFGVGFFSSLSFPPEQHSCTRLGWVGICTTVLRLRAGTCLAASSRVQNSRCEWQLLFCCLPSLLAADPVPASQRRGGSVEPSSCWWWRWSLGALAARVRRAPTAPAGGCS